MGIIKTITVMGQLDLSGKVHWSLVRQFPEAFSIHALVVGSDVDGLWRLPGI